MKVSEDKFWRSDENSIVDEARYICNGLKRICELIPCEMQEVYDWYKWQILGDLTEKNACDFSEEELRFAALDMALGINLLAQQQRRMDHFCLMTEKEQAEKEEKDYLTAEELDEILLNAWHFEEYNYFGDYHRKWLGEDFDRLRTAALTYAQHGIGELMERFFARNIFILMGMKHIPSSWTPSWRTRTV